ncbi:MAG: DUF934 domain-containing protein [Pseudomonadota bacterium]
MSELAKIFRGDGFVDERYVQFEDDAAALAGHDADVILVRVERWINDASSRVLDGRRVGVFVDPAIVDDEALPKLLDAPVVAIDFPKFTDGRGYSVARTLRDQLGFGGELLATGDVLVDQVPLMVRCGFSAFSVSHEPTARALASDAFKGIDHIYQAPALGRDWQRRSRAATAGETGARV